MSVILFPFFKYVLSYYIFNIINMILRDSFPKNFQNCSKVGYGIIPFVTYPTLTYLLNKKKCDFMYLYKKNK